MKIISLECPKCHSPFFSCKIFVVEKQVALSCGDCFKGFTVSTDEFSIKMVQERVFNDG